MRLPLGIDQNICRLEITVQNAALMRVVNGPGNSHHEPGRPALVVKVWSSWSARLPPSMNRMLK